MAAKSKELLLLGLALLAGLACNLSIPGGFVPFQAPSGGSKQEVIDPFARVTVTPTPFMPTGATQIVLPTPIPEKTPTWGKFAGPSQPPVLPIPPPAEPLEQPPGQINVLLLGSDQRPDSGGFRTDSILLLTINPNEGIAHITSFPRDLFVYIPGWTMQRINTAHQRGGFELTRATFDYNFGFSPDYYALINFWAFEQGIDNLGGITVQAARSMTDHRDDYGNYTVPAGAVHMDGETALWYVRARYATSDFDRSRRQQEVLLAAFQKLISLNALARVPELYQLYEQSVSTNLDLENATPALMVAAQISNDPTRLTSYFIGPQQGSAYIIPSTGAWVFLPDHQAVRQLLSQALNAR